jgi:hypothetical protein
MLDRLRAELGQNTLVKQVENEIRVQTEIDK